MGSMEQRFILLEIGIWRLWVVSVSDWVNFVVFCTCLGMGFSPIYIRFSPYRYANAKAIYWILIFTVTVDPTSLVSFREVNYCIKVKNSGALRHQRSRSAEGASVPGRLELPIGCLIAWR